MKWLKNKIIGVLISFYGVEKNILSNKNSLEENINIISEKNTGTLLHSLKNNIVTQEVLNLKWRTYKVLKASENMVSEIIGYDKDGMPITKTTKKNHKKLLSKIKVDDYDTYPVEMVINNDEIVISSNDILSNESINIYDDITVNKDENGEIVSATHGEINSADYDVINKTERPISITRKSIPNFFIENFTKKLVVRKINDEKRLLEFYVSIYPDEYNRTSRIFLSSLKKVINNKTIPNMLDIEYVEFITYKATGVEDFLEFNYEIESFDKIIEYNGFYVIKFISNVIKNGEDILEQHRVVELDKKYENKTKK